MLLYSLLHLGAYEFPFDQIKQIRQRGSITCWTVGTRQAGLPLRNNHVTLSAGTNINSNEDCAQRFEAYGWHTIAGGKEGFEKTLSGFFS
jgi:transketolase